MDEQELTSAFGGFRPNGLDLDGAAHAIVRRRTDIGPTHKRRRRGIKAVVVGLVAGAVALGGTQIVSAVRDEPTVTKDGTELGQLSIDVYDTDKLWTVEVEQDGDTTCISTKYGSGGGGMCAEEWGSTDDRPQATFSSSPMDPGGADRIFVAIIASADRRVGLVPRRYDVEPSTEGAVDLSELEGVHKATVKLSGVERNVWTFVLGEGYSDGGPSVEPIYLD